MDTPNSTTTKRCTKCGQEYPATREFFVLDKRNKSGIGSHCRKCQAERNKEYYAANSEHHAQLTKTYYESHKEEILVKARDRYKVNREHHLAVGKVWREANRERVASKEKVWYEKNRERVAEKSRKWYEANRERRKSVAKTWVAANPDNVRAIRLRRRARKVGNGGNYTPEDAAAIRAAQTDKQGRLICWRCGKPIKGTPHLDHWIPLKHGGRNDAGNLHYMHGKCNQSKGAKLPTEIGRLL
jgi:hypothetical protein